MEELKTKLLSLITDNIEPIIMYIIGLVIGLIIGMD